MHCTVCTVVCKDLCNPGQITYCIFLIFLYKIRNTNPVANKKLPVIVSKNGMYNSLNITEHHLEKTKQKQKQGDLH